MSLGASAPGTSPRLGVHLHVVAQARFAGEVLLTDVTLERLYTSVDPQMVVEVAPVVKLATTFLTFKWPFT